MFVVSICLFFGLYYRKKSGKKTLKISKEKIHFSGLCKIRLFLLVRLKYINFFFGFYQKLGSLNNTAKYVSMWANHSLCWWLLILWLNKCNIYVFSSSAGKMRKYNHNFCETTTQAKNKQLKSVEYEGDMVDVRKKKNAK